MYRFYVHGPRQEFPPLKSKYNQCYDSHHTLSRLKPDAFCKPPDPKRSKCGATHDNSEVNANYAGSVLVFYYVLDKSLSTKTSSDYKTTNKRHGYKR